jgi:hypothetical protein
MRRVSGLALLAAIALVAALAPSPADAAHYRGRSVDGHWYSGDLSHPDFGTIRNVQARFEGDRVLIGIPGGGQLNCHLEDEEITDPDEIPCMDYRRGVVWLLDVHGLAR